MASFENSSAWPEIWVDTWEKKRRSWGSVWWEEEKELLVKGPVCLASEVHAPPPKTRGEYSGMEARRYDSESPLGRSQCQPFKEWIEGEQDL